MTTLIQRLSRLSILLLWLAASASVFGFTITRTSSPIFYIDTSITPTLQGMYVAYQINNNGGVSYPDIWVRIDTFGGGTISLAPGEDGLVHLGPLAAGQTKAAFFYLQASSATALAQTHTVRIYPSKNPIGELANANFSMTVEETIQANANKVVTVVTGPTPPQLGGIVTMTVTGDGGTVGAARIMSFSPAAYLNWRPDAYEMISSSITLSGGNSGTYNDQLMMIVASSSATAYVAVYQFRAVTTTTAPTTVSPIAFISSGTQVKHTTTGNYGSIPAITATDNLLTLGKQASPPALIGAGTITYTLTATNSGTADAILEDFTDTLPTTPGAATYIAGSSTFNGVAAPDPTISGSTLTWSGTFSLPAGTTRALTFRASVPNSLGSYTNRAVGHVVNVQIDTTLNTSDNAPATAVVANRGANISGSIYNDTNRNSIMDATESGTGLSLFAKLVPAATPAGPAAVVVAATNNLGAYSFTNVPPGSYLIVIDNNNLLSDVTPTIPAGWIGTEQPTEIRNVLVISADIPNQNFGLVNGRMLTGRTFLDNGATSGIANDGIVNGAEAGLAGNQLRLTDTAGTTVYSTATSDASGVFSLFIPGSIASGTQLKVSEINSAGYISTGGGAGNTGGTYNRTTDTITFSFAGTNYQGILFGDVLQNSFLNDSQQTGLPGSFVLHSHSYVANSAGQLSFSLAQVSTPNLVGWNPIIYLDANCNGQLEAGDQPITGPISVVSGQRICLLIKDAIPITAPFNAQHQITISANFQYTGATPALSQTNSRTALTIVGNPTTAGLTLVKAVDKQTALPGQTITYTLTYANNSSGSLSNIVIFDSTPAYTTFSSASAGALPGNLTAVSITSPAIGNAGSIRWNFTGALAPAQTGSVTLRVTVSQ